MGIALLNVQVFDKQLNEYRSILSYHHVRSTNITINSWFY